MPDHAQNQANRCETYSAGPLIHWRSLAFGVAVLGAWVLAAGMAVITDAENISGAYAGLVGALAVTVTLVAVAGLAWRDLRRRMDDLRRGRSDLAERVNAIHDRVYDAGFSDCFEIAFGGGGGTVTRLPTARAEGAGQSVRHRT